MNFATALIFFYKEPYTPKGYNSGEALSCLFPRNEKKEQKVREDFWISQRVFS